MKKNYTHVFLRFLFAVAVFVSVVALSGMMLGCRAVKKSVERSASSGFSVVHDTLMILGEKTDSFYRERIVHDTVIGVGGNEISFVADTFFIRDTVIRKGNVRLAIRGRSVDCSADSLTLVIARLVKDSVYLCSTNDSLYYENQRQFFALKDYQYKAEVVGPPAWRVWLSYLLAAMVGAFLVVSRKWLVVSRDS